MFIIHTYPIAVAFLFVSMVSWGSWANTQKATSGRWKFEFYNFDYVIGLLISSFLFAITVGSFGDSGRDFWSDIRQVGYQSVGNALLGGVLFNAANMLLMAAISLVGMSVAFSVGMGFSMILGVSLNYMSYPNANASLLFSGVGSILIAMIINAIAVRITSAEKESMKSKNKGLLLSLSSGLLMGFYYKFVIDSIFPDFYNPEPGKLSPYTSVFIFSISVFVSTLFFVLIFFLRNRIVALTNISSFFKGNPADHLMGFLGGSIWCLGMLSSVLASGKAGAAISYGLSSGATVIASFWGIWVWKEFNGAPRLVHVLLLIMKVCFVLGLVLIVRSR